jgi:hypothetical protein
MCAGKDCEAWKIRYLYRQKQINEYAKKLGLTITKGIAYNDLEQIDLMNEQPIDEDGYRKCAVCDNRFIANGRTKNKKYCSRECYERAMILIKSIRRGKDVAECG